jgi:peroxiredoxin Q/BCP
MKAGDKAIEFSLKDKDGKAVSLKDIRSDFTVLYFYPKDNTPGCTIEAIEFSKCIDDYRKLKTAIVGISGGDEKTKTKFCDANNLRVTLLSDPGFAVCKKYGLYGKKKFMGREYMGIFRTTFILDKNKKILKVFEAVKPAGHSKEVLKFIKGA